MTPDERRQLARTLAAIDRRHPLIDPRLRRRRRFGLLFMTACCVVLAAWIAILILTLPMRYTSHDWRGVWVGLDLAELAGFAATAAFDRPAAAARWRWKGFVGRSIRKFPFTFYVGGIFLFTLLATLGFVRAAEARGEVIEINRSVHQRDAQRETALKAVATGLCAVLNRPQAGCYR